MKGDSSMKSKKLLSTFLIAGVIALLWSSIFVTWVAKKYIGLQLGSYQSHQAIQSGIVSCTRRFRPDRVLNIHWSYEDIHDCIPHLRTLIFCTDCYPIASVFFVKTIDGIVSCRAGLDALTIQLYSIPVFHKFSISIDIFSSQTYNNDRDRNTCHRKYCPLTAGGL